ncbi:ATP-binding cassette domain-containing protein [bacterium]|nr:ATP-binding cassette domain-containing protein [bacterium]
MISVENVSKMFGPQTLYQDASFSIETGQKIALLGPNGAGKSTFFKILMGEEVADTGEIRTPKNYSMGMLRQEWEPPKDKSILQATLMEFKAWYQCKQDLEQLQKNIKSSETAQKNYAQQEEAFLSLGGFAVEQEAKELLSGLGFKEEQFDKPCQTLSGGWKMRVHLAGLLLQKPEALLLDEPTNHLDIQSVEWLERFLKNYPYTVLMITHDRMLAQKICKQVLEFAPPKLNKWPYRVERFEKEKVERMKVIQAEYENKMKELEHLEQFISRFKAKASKARQAQSRMKSAEKYREDMEKIKAEMPVFSKRPSKFSLQITSRLPKVVLSFENACFGYSQDKPLYTIDEVLIESGKKIGVIGQNGVGKSTFLKTCAGELKLLKGEWKKPDSVDVALFTQHRMEELPLQYTGINYLLESTQGNTITQIRGVCGTLGLGQNDLDKSIEVLSGGEKARLSLAKILLMKPGLLLLDEPTNHLDMEACDAMLKGLADYQGTVIVVSHNREFLDGLVDEIMEIDSPEVHRYLGNYSYWHNKQIELGKSQANQDESSKNNAGHKAKSSGKKSKEQKRQEALERQKKSQEKKNLVKKNKEIETQLEQNKQELASIDQDLMNPETMQSPEFANMMKRRKELEQSQAKLEEQWLLIQDQLE